jgi:hypothetical protein
MVVRISMLRILLILISIRIIALGLYHKVTHILENRILGPQLKMDHLDIFGRRNVFHFKHHLS